jgi:hypothetical protein
MAATSCTAHGQFSGLLVEISPQMSAKLGVIEHYLCTHVQSKPGNLSRSFSVISSALFKYL